MIKIIIELTKLRLSLLVAFSATFGFILASSEGINYIDLFLGPRGLAIPSNSIFKEPSAELDFDQKDQDSLPDYKTLDEILIKIIEEEASLESIISSGHDSEIVHRVYRLLLLSEYKRRQSAPGVKLTARSFGKERRYPITNAFLNDS